MRWTPSSSRPRSSTEGWRRASTSPPSRSASPTCGSSAGCEQEMLEEKLWFMDNLSAAFSPPGRDGAHLDRIPTKLFQQLGTREYPFLKPTDDSDSVASRSRRATASTSRSCWIRSSTPRARPTKRSSPRCSAACRRGSPSASSSPCSGLAGPLPRSARPLPGEARGRLRRLVASLEDAPVRGDHGHPQRVLGAQRGPLRGHPARGPDLEEVFFARERLVSDINGTIYSAGLGGYYTQYGKWPVDLSPVRPATR